MRGKLMAAPFALVLAGIVIGLIPTEPTRALGAVLFLAGGAVLGIAFVLLIAYAVGGLLFRSRDRWHRFN